jgi:hypothetical protein
MISICDGGLCDSVAGMQNASKFVHLRAQRVTHRPVPNPILFADS